MSLVNAPHWLVGTSTRPARLTGRPKVRALNAYCVSGGGGRTSYVFTVVHKGFCGSAASKCRSILCTERASISISRAQRSTGTAQALLNNPHNHHPPKSNNWKTPTRNGGWGVRGRTAHSPRHRHTLQTQGTGDGRKGMDVGAGPGAGAGAMVRDNVASWLGGRAP